MSFRSSKPSNACPHGTPTVSHHTNSHRALARHKASFSAQRFNRKGWELLCSAMNALILINDGNLSTDSQSAFLPGSGLTTPLTCVSNMVMWASKHNMSQMERWRGSVQIINQQNSEIEAEPHLTVIWAPACLGKERAKTVTKMIQLCNGAALLAPLHRRFTGSEVPQPPTYSRLLCLSCKRRAKA